MSKLKYYFMAALLILVVIGYTNFFLHKAFGIGCKPDPEPVVVVDDFSKPLIDSGYKPATITKPDLIPGDKLPESVEAVVYASGSAGDTEVEISVVTTPDNGAWLKATIDGNEVKWRKIAYWNPAKPVHNNRWSVIVAGSMVDGVDFSVGAGYDIFQLAGCRIGIESTVDINRDVLTTPSYIAVSGRISRRYGPVSVGAHLGYRAFEEPGLHAGCDLGLIIGI